MKKKLLFNILCVLIGLIPASCSSPTKKVSNSPRASIEKEIRQINQQCPIIYSDTGTELLGVELSGNTVVYKIHTDNQPLLDLISDPNSAKEYLFLSLYCKSKGNIAEHIAKDGYNIRYDYSNECRAYSVELEPGYISEMSNAARKDPQAISRKLLKFSLQLERSIYPMAMEDGIMIMEAGIDGRDIVYEIYVDEDIYDIDAVSQIIDQYCKDLVAETVKAAKNGDRQRALFINLCRKAQANLIYHFTGTKSKKSYEATINYDSLL